jgi:hypothetical protein
MMSNFYELVPKILAQLELIEKRLEFLEERARVNAGLRAAEQSECEKRLRMGEHVEVIPQKPLPFKTVREDVWPALNKYMADKLEKLEGLDVSLPSKETVVSD